MCDTAFLMEKVDAFRHQSIEALALFVAAFRDAAYQSAWLLKCYKLTKWWIRILTGTTELVRICSEVPVSRHRDDDRSDEIPLFEARAEKGGKKASENTEDDNRANAEIVYNVDLSILFSTQLKGERLQLEDRHGTLDRAFTSILQKKAFPNNGSAKTEPAIRLRRSLAQISLAHKLVEELNNRAKTSFAKTDPFHEKKLLQLWDMLMPHEPLPERFTNSWQKIGFQGKDPATDFRGMGMLGLDDLHYFASTYNIECRQVLESSRHEVSWYSFAIVGINITAWTINMLRTRKLQYLLYRYGPTKDLYHEIYCYVFVHFNNFWSDRVPSITVMDFERVFREFTMTLEERIARHQPMVLSSTQAQSSKRK